MKQSRRTFLSGTAGVAASLALMPGAFAQDGKKGGTMTIGASGMRPLNSAIQPGNATGLPCAQIFAGLIELDEKFKPVAVCREELGDFEGRSHLSLLAGGQHAVPRRPGR
jgi:hypothetical protein